MTSSLSRGPRPRVDPAMAYERSPLPDGVTLRLDANEGIPAVTSAADPELLRRYPDARPLEAMLAHNFGVESSQVFVAAGADELIDRCCRAFLPPGHTLLMAEPGFEMFPRYATLAGADLDTVNWPAGSFPRELLCARVTAQTAVIAVVTPNNPTGDVATADDLRAIADAAPHALIILDHAYVEFADIDLTEVALQLPNVVVLRTFSKAWGLAGCRVGYAIGPTPLIRPLRAAGSPFPVSSLSLDAAMECLVQGTRRRDAFVQRIRFEREELHQLLTRLSAAPRRSGGNFVFAELGPRSPQVRDALLDQGILVRLIANNFRVPLGLRIALPGGDEGFTLLRQSMKAALAGDRRMTSTTIERVTNETRVVVELNLAGEGRARVSTGVGFFDHLLASLARHARFDLVVRCDGDLVVDDHHTVEDVALALGDALDRALGDRRGITRFGDATVPLDEALARAAIDLSGRPFADVNLGLRRETIGTLATENIAHFLRSFAMAGRLALHVDVFKGENDHHRAESAFKAAALALRRACAPSGFADVPSTKGVL